MRKAALIIATIGFVWPTATTAPAGSTNVSASSCIPIGKDLDYLFVNGTLASNLSYQHQLQVRCPIARERFTDAAIT